MKLIRNYPNSRIPELDGIRAMAILLILFFHYINNQLPESNNIFLRLLQKATSLGWSGVDLFFVLSGFLIGGILIRNKESENYFKTFYIRRFYRIFPFYYVLIYLFIIAKYSGIGGSVFMLLT